MAGVQQRYATQASSEDYVTGKLWRNASIERCPWHPAGGCGFCRHGTYSRVSPPGTLIPRWYCRLEGATVSALPDFLASHRTGSLDELEAVVRAVELAPSLSAAADSLRTDIELPGALRYLTRLCRAVHAALGIIRGLDPERFLHVEPTIIDFATVLDTDSVLMSLREPCARYLPQLPTPLGFNPPRINVAQRTEPHQHRPGRDPPPKLGEAPG